MSKSAFILPLTIPNLTLSNQSVPVPMKFFFANRFQPVSSLPLPIAPVLGEDIQPQPPNWPLCLQSLLSTLAWWHFRDSFHESTAPIMTLPKFPCFPTSYQSIYKALTQPGDKTFYNLASILFPTLSFCESYFFWKRDFFLLMFNDSYFSYKVVVKYKPPTSFGAQANYDLFQIYRKHWLSWSYGETEQRHDPRGVSTLLLLFMTFALCVIYSSYQTVPHPWSCIRSAVHLFLTRLAVLPLARTP